jgi:hypothetical protein
MTVPVGCVSFKCFFSQIKEHELNLKEEEHRRSVAELKVLDSVIWMSLLQVLFIILNINEI